MNGRQLPSVVFTRLISKINFYLSGWRAKLFSMVGKVTLLKSTVFSIPIYQLVGCLVMASVIDKIEKLTHGFVWINDESSKKIHLIGWSSVTRLKTEGGLGIPSLRHLHKALLGKALFRLANHGSEPWAKWILSANNCETKVWNRRPTNSIFPLMKCILRASALVKEGFVRTSEGGILWALNNSHSYKIKSTVNLIWARLVQNLSQFQPWCLHSIWCLRVIPKIKIFLWHLVLGGIPFKAILYSQGWKGSPFCDLCIKCYGMIFICSLNVLMLLNYGI